MIHLLFFRDLFQWVLKGLLQYVLVLYLQPLAELGLLIQLPIHIGGIEEIPKYLVKQPVEQLLPIQQCRMMGLS